MVEKQENVFVEPVVVERDDVEEFNKGWLCNLGVRRSDGDVIIIADVDVVIPHERYLLELMSWKRAKGLRWCFGWNQLIYDGKDGKTPQRIDSPEPWIQEGGIVMFDRSLWERMGGASEWLKKLRGCDNELAFKARHLTASYNGFPQTLHHSWHPISPMKKGKHRKHNKAILEYMLKHPSEVISICKNEQWGSEDGPYCDKHSFYDVRVGK